MSSTLKLANAYRIWFEFSKMLRMFEAIDSDLPRQMLIAHSYRLDTYLFLQCSFLFCGILCLIELRILYSL